MQPLNFTRPTELNSALMENELLRYEVRHLRARLAAAEAGAARTGKGGKGGRSSKEQQGNQQAYDDLLWLLRRLDESPAGFALRRLEGFRVLRARYLAGQDK